MEETNNKSDNINKLNEKYISILKEYNIENTVLNNFNVINSYYNRIDMVVNEFIILNNNINSKNDIIKIKSILDFDCGKVNQYVYLNEVILLDYSEGDTDDYDPYVRLYEENINNFGIPILKSNKFPDGILYQIISDLSLYYSELNR